MDTLIESSSGVFLRRFPLTLVTAFGIIALALAAVGVYGIIVYAVTARTREFGIRLALGAGQTSMLGQVLGQASRLVLSGVVAGLVGAAALSTLLSSMLFGIDRYDPTTYALIAGALALIALLAALPPAIRAMRTDPATALRHE